MKLVCYALIVFFVIQACGTDVGNRVEFEHEKRLISDTIPLEEISHPIYMTIKNQNLIIISSKSDSVLFFYSLPELKYIKSMGRKGSGPEEFYFPMFCESMSEDLFLWGYMNLLQIKRFSIDASSNACCKRLNSYI